jgi:hypothetical protein
MPDHDISGDILSLSKACASGIIAPSLKAPLSTYILDAAGASVANRRNDENAKHNKAAIKIPDLIICRPPYPL